MLCGLNLSSGRLFHRVKMAKKKVEDKIDQNDDNTKNEDDISSNDEEPNFSDPEGYFDDVSDEGINHKLLIHILHNLVLHILN